MHGYTRTVQSALGLSSMKIRLNCIRSFKNLLCESSKFLGELLCQKLAVKSQCCKAANGSTQGCIEPMRINFSNGRSEFSVLVSTLQSLMSTLRVGAPSSQAQSQHLMSEGIQGQEQQRRGFFWHGLRNTLVETNDTAAVQSLAKACLHRRPYAGRVMTDCPDWPLGMLDKSASTYDGKFQKIKKTRREPIRSCCHSLALRAGSPSGCWPVLKGRGPLS